MESWVYMDTSNLFRKKSKSGHSRHSLLCLSAKSRLRRFHISQLQICDISWNQICVFLLSDLLQTLPWMSFCHYQLGKPYWNSCRRHLGIALIAFASPPRTLGHFFPGRFEQLCQVTVWGVNNCHKKSWQALNPFFIKENAQSNFNFHCISAPNHHGKGLDPPKIKQMPIWSWKILL